MSYDQNLTFFEGSNILSYQGGSKKRFHSSQRTFSLKPRAQNKKRKKIETFADSNCSLNENEMKRMNMVFKIIIKFQLFPIVCMISLGFA